MTRALAFGLVCLVAGPAPAPAQERVPLTQRYEFDTRSLRKNLPGRLDEISGLGFNAEGRLFAHDDERGWIHEIDAETGEVGKRFMVGDQTARDDFEGIAIVGERFFLASSRGLLYETREGADREEVPYRVTNPRVGADCEVEGLEYLARRDELLFLCKTASSAPAHILIHRVPLDPNASRPPPIRIARSQLERIGLEPSFHGSALAYDPMTQTLILAAAQEEALIEVTLEGEVVDGLHLNPRRHAQSEGLAIGRDGTLYVADEKNGRDARITLYRPRSTETSR